MNLACHAYWTIKREAGRMLIAPLGLTEKVLIVHGIRAWKSLHPGNRMALVTDYAGRETFERSGLIGLYDDVSIALDELHEMPELLPTRYFSLGKLFATGKAYPGAVVFDLDLYLLEAPVPPRRDELLVAHREGIEPGGGVYADPADLCHGHDECFADLNRRLPQDAQNMAFYWPGDPAAAAAVFDVALAFSARHRDPTPSHLSEISYVLHAEQRLPAAVADSMGMSVRYLSSRTWWPERNQWDPTDEVTTPYHHMWVQQKALHDAFPVRRLGYLWLILVELLRRFPDSATTVRELTGDEAERRVVDHVISLAQEDFPDFSSFPRH